MTLKNDERHTKGPGWIHLGATGLLQPLSEEFLYRAPQNRAAHTCRPQPSRRSGRGDHAPR